MKSIVVKIWLGKTFLASVTDYDTFPSALLREITYAELISRNIIVETKFYPSNYIGVDGEGIKTFLMNNRLKMMLGPKFPIYKDDGAKELMIAEVNEGLFLALTNLTQMITNGVTTFDIIKSEPIYPTGIPQIAVLMNNIDHIIEHFYAIGEPSEGREIITHFIEANPECLTPEITEKYQGFFSDDISEIAAELIKLELSALIAHLDNNIGNMHLDAFLRFKGLDLEKTIEQNFYIEGCTDKENNFLDYIRANPDFYLNPSQHLIDIINKNSEQIVAIAIQTPEILSGFYNILASEAGYKLKNCLNNFLEAELHDPQELFSDVYCGELEKLQMKLEANLYDFNKPLKNGKILIYSATTPEILQYLMSVGFPVDQAYLDHLKTINTASSSPAQQKADDKQAMIKLVEASLLSNNIEIENVGVVTIPEVSDIRISELTAQKEILEEELSNLKITYSIIPDQGILDMCNEVAQQIENIDIKLVGYLAD
jgi:hypothetical protein